MRIAVITCNGFNEIDSFVSNYILNRVDAPGWRSEITSPSAEVVSRNGVRVLAQQPLEFASEADVVLFGSGTQSLELSRDPALLSRLRLDPRRQLIGSQCSGALFMAALGLLGDMPVCTDMNTRPVVEAAGLRVLDQTFTARGNLASVGGCLGSPYLASWVITRKLGRQAAEAALEYVAPVGEATAFIAGILDVVEPLARTGRAPETTTA
jgi:transcriptional regulator GlxA family with amidase domain